MNHPNPNTSTTFTNITNWKNQEKMGNDEHNIILHHDPHQFPMGSGTWPNPLHTQSSSNVALLTDMLGDQFEEDGEEELGAMKEMMYKMAAMQPVEIDPASIRKPKRRNVRISDDPQSVAARHRRERISEKIGILQRLVPGGTKMDTAAMLDEAIRYVKFLKRQIRLLQSAPLSQPPPPLPINCIAAPPPNNINNGASFLLHTTGGDWPIAPNVLHGSTTTSASSSVEMMAGVEFNTSGHVHALDASSSFNNHEVIN